MCVCKSLFADKTPTGDSPESSTLIFQFYLFVFLVVPYIYVYTGPRSLGGKKCDFHVLDSISPSVSFGVDLTRDVRTIAAALAVGFEILFFTIITT